MIVRRRSPDGSSRDIDYGGGPFGDFDVRHIQRSQSTEPIQAMPVAAVQMRVDRRAANRRYLQNRKRCRQGGS